MSKILQVRIDEDLKESADFVLKTVGLDLSTAIRMFLLKVVRTGGIPFEPVIEKKFDRKAFNDALDSIYKHAKDTGLDRMTLNDINEIIAEVRKEQK